MNYLFEGTTVFTQVRDRNPLIHCITNYVAANLQANGLLAIGASPVMADGPDEVEEIVEVASALSINIGTLNPQMRRAMLKAGKAANKRGMPVLLDPVAVGAATYRKEAVRELLQEVHIDAIRCNLGELAALVGAEWEQKGVDSGTGAIHLEREAKKVALEHGCLVIVTGEKDYLTDGERERWVEGGHEMITQVTGSGCLLSSVCTAILASCDSHRLDRLAEGLFLYKKASEEAYQTSPYPASFQAAFLDRLFVHASGRGEA
ncbi:hydroxyethylthiazole kinase [Pradoshia eiseniae]|uniref:Hydroxyethylthiazole kinase n=1 Tax=Pradoshia eiseniae TaxID=2064768 RepID=A0A2S7N3N3_9BACI|nr:hydroxyethylthiazole kinase [Pradoshia eiseniae]PQD96692.1 hydroxyethylthiazole kinase [Pradoshia eiseniae]